MRERGAGAVVFTLGSSALAPTPMMAQVGIALSGLRHHLIGLAGEVTDRGVHVAVAVIGGLILGSDLQRTWVPDANAGFPGALDPSDIAVTIDELVASGDVERRIGPYAQGH